MTEINEIKSIIGDVLGLGERVQTFTAGTELIGSIPEFDSMAVVSVLTAIEEHYGIVIEDDEVSVDIFLTIGTLAEFIHGKL